MVTTVRRDVTDDNQILIADCELLPYQIRKTKSVSSAGVWIVDGCRWDAAWLEVNGRSPPFPLGGSEENELDWCPTRKNCGGARSLHETVSRQSQAGPQLAVSLGISCCPKPVLECLEIGKHGLDGGQH